MENELLLSGKTNHSLHIWWFFADGRIEEMNITDCYGIRDFGTDEQILECVKIWGNYSRMPQSDPTWQNNLIGWAILLGFLTFFLVGTYFYIKEVDK